MFCSKEEKQPHCILSRSYIKQSSYRWGSYGGVFNVVQLQSSWKPGSSSRKKTTKLQVLSIQQPRCTAFMQRWWIFVPRSCWTFYHHPCSHVTARVTFREEWRHTKSVEGSCFLKGRGQDCLCGKILLSTNKPWFSNLYQPLGEWRGWFFPNCVYHHSHMALLCQNSVWKDLTKTCRCVFVSL